LTDSSRTACNNERMTIRSSARNMLRSIGLKFPQLRKYSGKLGLGRLIAPTNSFAQITIDSNVTIELDMSVPMFRHIYYHHDLSASPEVKVMKTLLKKDQTCLDVGAHIGYFSLVAAKYAHHVIAFEPSPTTFKMLERNLSLNPTLASKIRAEECGLSDHAGTLTLYNSKSQPDLASLEPIDVADGYTQEIKLATLDERVSDNGGLIALIKIDVEGAEYGVLLGGMDLIKKHRPVIMLELFEEFQNRFGHTCTDIVTLLTNIDYQPYLITKPGLKLRTLNVSELSTQEVNNALFVPAEIADTIVHLINDGATA
jgi:FkbM family methyltransferase